MTRADRIEEHFTKLERRVRRVFQQNPTLKSQLSDFSWSIGALGDPFAGIWFVAENPAAARVQAIGKSHRDAPSRELQWAASKGDALFRRALVAQGFKDRPAMGPGGWHCYITDVIKSPVVVKDWKRTKGSARTEILRLWAPVLRWELEVSRPKLIVTMGANARGMFDELLAERLVNYSGDRAHVTHYAAIGNQPSGHLPPMEPSRVRAYLREFARVGADWKQRGRARRSAGRDVPRTRRSADSHVAK